MKITERKQPPSRTQGLLWKVYDRCLAVRSMVNADLRVYKLQGRCDQWACGRTCRPLKAAQWLLNQPKGLVAQEYLYLQWISADEAHRLGSKESWERGRRYSDGEGRKAAQRVSTWARDHQVEWLRVEIEHDLEEEEYRQTVKDEETGKTTTHIRTRLSDRSALLVTTSPLNGHDRKGKPVARVDAESWVRDHLPSLIKDAITAPTMSAGWKATMPDVGQPSRKKAPTPETASLWLGEDLPSSLAQQQRAVDAAMDELGIMDKTPDIEQRRQVLDRARFLLKSVTAPGCNETEENLPSPHSEQVSGHTASDTDAILPAVRHGLSTETRRWATTSTR